MQLPFFYEPSVTASGTQFILSENTSRHCAQVLRMREGDKIQLVNGYGLIATVVLEVVNKKNTVVSVWETTQQAPPAKQVHIAVSLLKNPGRFEWFLEKAAEIGVHTITPLICDRTEKHQFRKDRLENILISAMLQSRQAYRAQLADLVQFNAFINQPGSENKFIAHCESSAKKLLYGFCPLKENALMLIGPEGDFSPAEIDAALNAGFQPVSLGETRLRTETAAMYSAVLLSL